MSDIEEIHLTGVIAYEVKIFSYNILYNKRIHLSIYMINN